MANEFDSFLSAAPAASQPRVERALQTLCDGIKSGSIYNTDFQAMKDTLSRAAESIWKTLVNEKHTYAGKYAMLPEEVQKFIYSFNVFGSHDVTAASKKVAKTKLNHPAIDACRAAVAILLPVTEAINSLKPMVIKGRKPNPEAVAKRAAALEDMMPRATCACCFRNQAVLPNGLIHDHGYQLPHTWMKTVSCHGRQFRPLEVSSDGLKFMIKLLESAEKSGIAAVETAKAAKHITLTNFRREKVVYTSASEGWSRVLAMKIHEAESNLSQVRQSLEEFKKALAVWKAA